MVNNISNHKNNNKENNEENEATVFIVDDDQSVRDALKLLMLSVGLHAETYESGQDYLDSFNPHRAGCLILDVRMKGISGLALQEYLSKQPLAPPIIMITGHGDIAMAVRAVQTGALDFIEKPFNDQALLESIHRALEQDAKKRGQAMAQEELKRRLAQLTQREKEVLSQVVAGKRNKIIAAELHITQSTVEAHRSRVMEKMQAKSLSDLMRMVLSIGLIN